MASVVGSVCGRLRAQCRCLVLPLLRLLAALLPVPELGDHAHRPQAVLVPGLGASWVVLDVPCWGLLVSAGPQRWLGWPARRLRCRRR